MTKVYNKKERTLVRKILRNKMPDAEVILWSKLKNRQVLGAKFRRQYGIEEYAVDFFCPELRLAIELDGDTHFIDDAQVKDKRRQEKMEMFGIQFLRFYNNDIYKNLRGVLTALEKRISELRDEINSGKKVSPPLQGGVAKAKPEPGR
ncbi:MAG: endonuclease domain-containing protein [Nitrospinae bacterium]|nr:endonuclease domain-containing protein [Nitrospinota bacterium]